MNFVDCGYRLPHSEDFGFECCHPAVVVPQNFVTVGMCHGCPFSGPRTIFGPKHVTVKDSSRSIRLKDIAVIIPCHNYGAYLAEAIESVLNQTVPATEIVVVIDSSTDDSEHIALAYESQGVRTLVVGFGNVHSVRRLGFQETQADVLCFLDADDWISPEYLEYGMAQFDSPKVGVVYSDLDHFGASSRKQVFPEAYSQALLNRQNYIHAGSLVRRDALELSGVFEVELDAKTASRTADWWMWRRIAQTGWSAKKQPGRYHYRRHEASALASNEETSYFQVSWMEHEEITLFVPLSGRYATWDRLVEFLEAQLWPHAQTRLVLLDTSQNPNFAKLVKNWLANSDYQDFRYLARSVSTAGLADSPRLQNVSAVREAMARIYNTLRTEATTPYVWILEDDVIPPPDVAIQLLKHFDARTGSVAAPYRSRFHDGYVVWMNETTTCMNPGNGVSKVGGNGFGCTILRSELLQDTMFSHRARLPDFDHAFYSFLNSKGVDAKVNWDVECLHLESDSDRKESATHG